MSSAIFRAAAAATAVFFANPAWALNVSVETPLQSPVVGQAFSANVVIDGVDELSELAFFDIDLVFDPAILRLEEVSLSDALGSLADGDAVDASLPLSPGVINLSVLSLLDDLGFQAATFPIATLVFTPLTSGATTLEFGFVGLENSLAEALAFSTVDANFTVVPLPAALWMFAPAVGLLGLTGRSRRAA